MSPEIITRPARIEDAEGIFETHKRSIQEVCSKDYSPEQIAAWFPVDRTPQYYADKIPDREYFVAEINDRIVGVARIEGSYISILYTHPDFLNRGVGKALFDHIETVLKNNGHQKIELNSTVTAHPFYERMGMVTIEKSKYLFDNGIEVAIFKMEKQLV